GSWADRARRQGGRGRRRISARGASRKPRPGDRGPTGRGVLGGGGVGDSPGAPPTLADRPPGPGGPGPGERGAGAPAPGRPTVRCADPDPSGGPGGLPQRRGGRRGPPLRGGPTAGGGPGEGRG